MSHPQKISSQIYESRLNAIRAASAPTLAKVDAGEFDWRDVAILIEQLARFGDMLGEMLDKPPELWWKG